MTIAVDSGDFEKEITARLKDAAQKVRLDGFRRGKVPLKEVRRRFGQSVRQEVAGEMMQSSFVQAVQQEDVAPAGSPSLEVMNIDAGDDLEFTATFEVFPHVELGDLSQISVKRPAAEITEDDLDAMIENLRTQRKTFESVTRGAAAGDQVTVDFTGKLDGEVFEGGTGEGVKFVVGEGQMIEDFDTGVLGVSAGQETAFDASFPEDYRAENLAGKTVHFEVKVTDVAEPNIPALDEEFAKTFGIEDGDLEKMRAEVRENMQREMDAALAAVVKRQVLDELARLHEVQLPNVMIDREVDNLRQQMMQQMGMYGGADGMPELPADMFSDEAGRRVKVGLVVSELIKDRGVEADAELVRARIEELAKPYAQPEQVINWYYSQEEQLAQIQMAVLEDQVIEIALASAQVEEITSNYADIVAGQAVDHESQETDDTASTKGDT